ncbi:hypothetical protein [Bernardetia sp. MNP-M8]|uniref:hypothetical protein n=1 Tax=Bernardetia sp. MNP-M8 TaxID=3127470 RepID=UPI0030D2A2D9
MNNTQFFELTFEHFYSIRKNYQNQILCVKTALSDMFYRFAESNKTIEHGKGYIFTWSEIVEVSNMKTL